eukprot:jgi/Psemu1/39168/gm1.39168_g
MNYSNYSNSGNTAADKFGSNQSTKGKSHPNTSPPKNTINTTKKSTESKKFTGHNQREPKGNLVLEDATLKSLGYITKITTEAGEVVVDKEDTDEITALMEMYQEELKISTLQQGDIKPAVYAKSIKENLEVLKALGGNLICKSLIEYKILHHNSNLTVATCADYLLLADTNKAAVDYTVEQQYFATFIAKGKPVPKHANISSEHACSLQIKQEIELMRQDPPKNKNGKNDTTTKSSAFITKGEPETTVELSAQQLLTAAVEGREDFGGDNTAYQLFHIGFPALLDPDEDAQSIGTVSTTSTASTVSPPDRIAQTDIDHKQEEQPPSVPATTAVTNMAQPPVPTTASSFADETTTRYNVPTVHQWVLAWTIEKAWILLHSESFINLTVNRQMITNVHKAPNSQYMNVHCNSGFYPEGFTNVLLLALVSDRFRVTMDTNLLEKTIYAMQSPERPKKSKQYGLNKGLKIFEMEQQALTCLMFLKQKRTGTVRGRICVDGRPRRAFVHKEDSTYPMPPMGSLCALMLTFSIPRAFLQTGMPPGEGVYIRLDSTMAKLLYEIGPAPLFGKAKKVILYGRVRAALLFLQNLSKQLLLWGFIMNPYNPWTIQNYQQQVIIWENSTPHRNPGEEFTMFNYVKDILQGLPKELDGCKVVSPACDHLIKYVGKLLFAAKRFWPVTQTVVAFLCTHINGLDIDDHEKRKRVLPYLKETRFLLLVLGYDGTSNICGYVNTVFAVHNNMRSHSGGFVTMGQGAVIRSSTKQNLNTKSSTKARLVDIDDHMGIICWHNGKVSNTKQTRHINIWNFFVTDQTKGEVTIESCPTKEMIEGYFTKPLVQESLFRKFRNLVLDVSELKNKYKQAHCKAKAAHSSTSDVIVNSSTVVT